MPGLFITSPLKYQVNFQTKTFSHVKWSSLLWLKKCAPFNGKKKYQSEMVCFFFGVNIMNNRTNITLPLGGTKFLFSYWKLWYIVYFTWLQTFKEKFCTFTLSCNILYVSWAWRYILWKTHLYSFHHSPPEWQEAAVFCTTVTMKFDIWLLKIKGATPQRKLAVLFRGSL